MSQTIWIVIAKWGAYDDRGWRMVAWFSDFHEAMNYLEEATSRAKEYITEHYNNDTEFDLHFRCGDRRFQKDWKDEWKNLAAYYEAFDPKIAESSFFSPGNLRYEVEKLNDGVWPLPNMRRSQLAEDDSWLPEEERW